MRDCTILWLYCSSTVHVSFRVIKPDLNRQTQSSKCTHASVHHTDEPQQGSHVCMWLVLLCLGELGILSITKGAQPLHRQQSGEATSIIHLPAVTCLVQSKRKWSGNNENHAYYTCMGARAVTRFVLFNILGVHACPPYYTSLFLLIIIPIITLTLTQ